LVGVFVGDRRPVVGFGREAGVLMHVALIEFRHLGQELRIGEDRLRLKRLVREIGRSVERRVPETGIPAEPRVAEIGISAERCVDEKGSPAETRVPEIGQPR